MLGLILSGGVQFLLERISDNTVAVMRISAVCQGMIAFILPAMALAVLVTRLPAEFLMIKRFPKAKPLGLAVAALIVGFPIIEWINSMCALLPWPDAILNMEAQAEAQTMKMLGVHNIANLMVSILIIGVLTGLAEELFFRGALQRVLQTRPMSIHAAVWIAAIVFSLMHAQMVGFIPRTLLGALFGYAAVWTGSLWTAIILHALNNTCAILVIWLGIDFSPNPVVCLISTILLLVILRFMKSSAGVNVEP